MRETQVLIVGGGPAGSACAWALRRAGVETIVVDKQSFPRLKLCAGWITPRVLRQLRINPQHYPHSLTRFKTLHFYIRGRPLTIPTRQYAIRRVEFDAWLLKRAHVPVVQHRVSSIVKKGDTFVVDDQYRSRYLVGAGGTACPVYRTVFREHMPRVPQTQLTTLELEVPYDFRDPRCFLWFFDKNLPGYSWYVPKQGGTLNLGIGAKAAVLQKRGETIQHHWLLFLDKLRQLGLIGEEDWHPKGYTYFLRSPVAKNPQAGPAFVIGDAAGLATLDMGEGIGPAVESGLCVANAILHQKPVSFKRVNRYSALPILFPELLSVFELKNKEFV